MQHLIIDVGSSGIPTEMACLVRYKPGVMGTYNVLKVNCEACKSSALYNQACILVDTSERCSSYSGVELDWIIYLISVGKCLYFKAR